MVVVVVVVVLVVVVVVCCVGASGCVGSGGVCGGGDSDYDVRSRCLPQTVKCLHFLRRSVRAQVVQSVIRT